MPTPSGHDLRQLALWYLDKLIAQGLPYIWGGDDPIAGFDCSGNIVEIFQGIGLLPHRSDFTAHDLYLKYKVNPVEPGAQRPGDLVFWLKDGKARHIEMLITEKHTIGASGGGPPKFNLYNETRKCPFLMSIYGVYTRDGPGPNLKDIENTFFLKFVKAELYRQQAVDQNAYFKLRPLDYRGPNYKICDPYKENTT